MKKLILGVIVIAAIGLLAFDAIRKQSQEGAGAIKIGVPLILSGDSASWGESAKKGIDLAVGEWRNSHPDRVIELIYEDTAGEAKQVVNIYQKFTTTDKVDAILGPLFQIELAAIIPLVQKNALPVVAPNYAPISIRPNPRNPLLVWMDTETEAERIAEYVYREGARRVSVIGTKDPWETEVADTFYRKFNSLGGKVVYQDMVQQDANDVKSSVTHALAEKPDAVFIGTYYQFINTVKTIRDMGYKGRLFGIEVDQYLAGETKNASNGLQFIAPDFYATDFVARFEAKYKEKPGIPAGQAYDAANILLSFFEKASSKEEVLEEMRKIEEYNGASGLIQFTKENKTILPTAIFELRDGNAVKISP